MTECAIVNLRSMKPGYRSAGSRRGIARSGGTQPKPMPQKKDSGKDSALDYVKKSIEAKYGKGAIMDTSKKKKNEEYVAEKKDCVKKEKKTMHNCAKKVCSEQWGVGECVYGQHAVPDADGNVAWYDVMFEHGIEKGVDVSTLEVLEEGSHGEHVEHEGEMVEAKVDTYKKLDDEGKEDARNLRKFGTSHNQHGHAVLRRALHRSRRGDKKVKGEKPVYEKESVEHIEEKKKGLWDNIHAKRKRGEKPAKPGDKDYPKTLNVEGYDKPDEKLKTDRDGYRVPQKDADAAKARLLAKAKAKRAKLKEDTLMEKGMSEKDMDSVLKGHKYSKKQLMDMSKKSTQQGRHGEASSMYKAARAMKEDTINERGDFWHPDPDKDRKLGGPGANQRAREDRAAASKPKSDPKKLRPGESYMDYAKRMKTRKEDWQKTYKEFITEGNRTGRMMQKSKTQVTGHISADRGSDEKKNREKRKGLEKDLKKHGIGHKKGVGEYKYDSGETGREVSYQTSKPDKMSKRRFGKVMRRLGRKHGQESVITKDKDKSAKLHYTEKGSKAKSDSIGKTKAGKHPDSYGETSGTKVRSGKLPKKTNKGAYHYG